MNRACSILLCLWLALPCLKSAYVTYQQHLYPWVAGCRDLKILRSFLRSNCSELFNSTVQGLNSTSGFTLFAPTDKAWRNTFNMTGFKGFDTLNCTADASDCPRLLSGNLSSLSLEDIAPCLPLMSLYHLANGTFDALYNVTDTINITVIPSALNMTFGSGGYAGVNLSQVLVSNVTEEYAYVQGGGNSTANVTNTYPARDGRVYMLNRVLIPPLYLNYTLNSLNQTLGHALNQAMNQTMNSTMNGMMNSTMHNTTLLNQGNQTYTFFIPVNATQAFNLTSYMVPQVIYLNGTLPSTANLTAIDGSQIIFDIRGNDTAIVNGNVSVVRANIPLVNGVLHLLNNTLGAMNISNTVSAMALRANMNRWRHWINAH